MPPVIDRTKCIGCHGAAESNCERICPGDLMIRDESGKATIRKARDCWDCMCCVKVCPVGAIALRTPFELGARGAELIPKVCRNEITWTCTDIYGKTEVYTVTTRNTGDKIK